MIPAINENGDFVVILSTFDYIHEDENIYTIYVNREDYASGETLFSLNSDDVVIGNGTGVTPNLSTLLRDEKSRRNAQVVSVDGIFYFSYKRR